MDRAGRPCLVRRGPAPGTGAGRLSVLFVLAGCFLAARAIAAAPPDLPEALPRPVAARRDALPSGATKPAPASVADLRAIESQVQSVLKRVSPSVIAVQVGGAVGTAVIVSADGLALTAGHVAGRPNRDVRITFANGKTGKGKTLAADHDADIGLLRVSGTGPWDFVPVADLQDTQTGDWVLALGHPGGFDSDRSLVARLGRIIRFGRNTLQSDCTISPGDSGGPLFDLHGRVVGIHTEISGSMTANFHVPVTRFYRAWDPTVLTSTGERKGPE